MKKLFALVFFFGFFNMAVAQMSPPIIPSQSIDSITNYWQQYRSQMQAVVPLVAPAPASPLINALTSVYRAATLPVCSQAYIDHCKTGQDVHFNPINGNEMYCSWVAQQWPFPSGYDVSMPCQGNRNSCVPLKTKCRVVSPPAVQPLLVREIIGSTPICPNRRISLNFEITGGAKNYSISIDNRLVSSNNIGFFSTEKNTSQSVRVFISDSSSPRKTWSKTITLPACRQVGCKNIDEQDACERNFKCEWIPPQPLGDALMRGYCTDKPDPQPAPLSCDPQCSANQICCAGPVGGIGSNRCVTGNSCPPLRCLSSLTRIATPIGDVAVTSLKVGDIVWTADAAGNRVVRPLIKVSRVSAPNHRVVHLVLADGRSLDVSALHPAAGGMVVGDLQVGDIYDGSTVQSAVLKAYEGTATYDILPAGETGYYWANGILMGSTLK